MNIKVARDISDITDLMAAATFAGMAVCMDEADVKELAEFVKGTPLEAALAVVICADEDADMVREAFSSKEEKVSDPVKTSTRSGWTEEEDAILRANYPVGGYRACVDKLSSRSKDAITSRARKLGLTVTGVAPVAEEANETVVIEDVKEEPVVEAKKSRNYSTSSKTHQGRYDASHIPGRDVLLRDEETGLIYIGTRPHTFSYYNVCCIDPATARRFYREAARSKSSKELKTTSGKTKFSVDQRDEKLYKAWATFMDETFDLNMK